MRAKGQQDEGMEYKIVPTQTRWDKHIQYYSQYECRIHLLIYECYDAKLIYVTKFINLHHVVVHMNA